jgi:hypothetical protein
MAVFTWPFSQVMRSLGVGGRLNRAGQIPRDLVRQLTQHDPLASSELIIGGDH